jgi:hypothetical protein
LPLFPGSKGIWGVASVLHFQLLARIGGGFLYTEQRSS